MREVLLAVCRSRAQLSADSFAFHNPEKEHPQSCRRSVRSMEGVVDLDIPVPVRLARLVVLGRVLRFWRGKNVRITDRSTGGRAKLKNSFGCTYWPWRRLLCRSLIEIVREVEDVVSRGSIKAAKVGLRKKTLLVGEIQFVWEKHRASLHSRCGASISATDHVGHII